MISSRLAVGVSAIPLEKEEIVILYFMSFKAREMHVLLDYITNTHNFTINADNRVLFFRHHFYCQFRFHQYHFRRNQTRESHQVNISPWG